MQPYEVQMEMFGEFLGGLIPFNSSIQEAKKGNYVAAVAYGALDLVGGELEDAALKTVEKGFTEMVAKEGLEETKNIARGGLEVSREAEAGANQGITEAMATEAHAAPAGNYYSVAFEVQMPGTMYPGVSRPAHNQFANAALDASMKADAGFSKMISDLGITVPKTKIGVYGRVSPDGWRWHHAVDQGLLQLVPVEQHTPGSIFWNVMHTGPNGAGGWALWGR